MNDTPALSAETLALIEKALNDGRGEAFDFQRRCAYGLDGPHWQTQVRFIVPHIERLLNAARSDHQPTGEVEELARRLEAEALANHRGATREMVSDAAQALRSLSGQVAELEEQLGRRRIGTHDPNCHTYGPRHYDCLLVKFEAAEATIEHQAQELSELKKAVTEAAWAFEGGETLRRRNAAIKRLRELAALNEVKSNG